MRNAMLFLAGQALPRREALPQRLFGRLLLWRRRVARMRALRALDDRLLQDVGVARDQLGNARLSARWDAPPYWTWNG